MRLRFKQPDSDESQLVTHPIGSLHEAESTSSKFVFASTVAQLGLVLRQSVYMADTDTSLLDDRLLEIFLNADYPAVEELLSMIEKVNGLRK